MFTADSVRRALDWMEKRNRKPGNVRKDWGYVLGILRNRAQTGWPEEAPAAPPEPAKKTAPTGEPTAAEQAREDRLRGLWAALGEGRREEIRAAVKAENPGLVRWPNLLEPLYLAELERLQPAEEPRPPGASDRRPARGRDPRREGRPPRRSERRDRRTGWHREGQAGRCARPRSVPTRRGMITDDA